MALCFLVFVPALSEAEEITDTIIYTGELSIDPLNRTSISENDFSYITARSWNLTKRQLTIHSLDLITYQIKKHIVKVPTSMKLLQCPAIAMSDSFLLLQDDYTLKWFLFKMAQEEFKLVEEIKLPSRTMAFTARSINSDHFLFTDIYNHHPLDSVYNTSLTIYNARERKFMNTIHPEVPCIGLSHFPQNWISHSKSLVAMAEPCGNLISLYDMKLNQAGKIFIPKSKRWIDLKGNKIPIETSPEFINPKELIAKFESHISTFSRIETIHFANDSILLISVSQPEETGSTTENFVYNINTKQFIDTHKIQMNTSSEYGNPEKLSFQIEPYHLFKNGICISLEEDNYFPEPTLSKEENENRKNTFYENNDPEFIIRVSKVKISK